MAPLPFRVFNREPTKALIDGVVLDEEKGQALEHILHKAGFSCEEGFQDESTAIVTCSRGKYSIRFFRKFKAQRIGK